ncbi:MAG: DUF1329 domain-containing protein [Pseudomonadota bacterium]
MRIKKYDFEFSRRTFLEKTARGLGGAGVLASLWPTVASSGDIEKVYPEELLNIEAYTKGQVKVGDEINADNVEVIKDLIDPICYQEVKQDGRTFYIIESERNVSNMFSGGFFEATLRNQGMAMIDGTGNCFTKNGEYWLGGLPFPDPQTGLEAIANLTMSWGRNDAPMYAIPTLSLGPEGNVEYDYELVWAELNCIGLVNGGEGPYLPGHEGKLRYQATWFTNPNDVKGTAFLNVWPYDQREFPDLFGYIPSFKRVRRFPTNQRFEPLVAGLNLFLSDAWASGDPWMTWGNYKVVGRQPFLGSTHDQWMGDKPNWAHDLVGGAEGKSYLRVGKALIPEVIVLEAEPLGYPRAPVSKKRIYIDVRNQISPQTITFDRRGELWKSFEPGNGRYVRGDLAFEVNGSPSWSWNWVISHDIQTNRISHFYQGEKVSGGYRSNHHVEDMYDSYMTRTSMRRLGT